MFTVTHKGFSSIFGLFKKFYATVTSSKPGLSNAVFQQKRRCFLGDGCSYMNGRIIAIDGGRSDRYVICFYDPGYYVTDKTYYLETNIYDAKTEELIWSAQSATYNPSDINSFLNGYLKSVERKMKDDGLLVQ